MKTLYDLSTPENISILHLKKKLLLIFFQIEGISYFPVPAAAGDWESVRSSRAGGVQAWSSRLPSVSSLTSPASSSFFATVALLSLGARLAHMSVLSSLSLGTSPTLGSTLAGESWRPCLTCHPRHPHWSRQSHGARLPPSPSLPCRAHQSGAPILSLLSGGSHQTCNNRSCSQMIPSMTGSTWRSRRSRRSHHSPRVLCVTHHSHGGLSQSPLLL